MWLNYDTKSTFFFEENQKKRILMGIKEFFGKFKSPFLWGNLLAMAIVVLTLCFGVQYSLNVYTHHGEGIEVPDLYGKSFMEAAEQMGSLGIYVVANDTGYNKKMDANCILLQVPGPGTKVKEGRTIYVTVNSTSSPTLKIPDIIENCSYREAQARLTAIGFHLSEPKAIEGERDWVYGVMAGNKSLQTGDLVSIETPLTLVVGDGSKAEESEEDMMLDIPEGQANEIDDFQEVTGPEE